MISLHTFGCGERSAFENEIVLKLNAISAVENSIYTHTATYYRARVETIAFVLTSTYLTRNHFNLFI